jgi:hypothetical protein
MSLGMRWKLRSAFLNCQFLENHWFEFQVILPLNDLLLLLLYNKNLSRRSFQNTLSNTLRIIKTSLKRFPDSRLATSTSVSPSISQLAKRQKAFSSLSIKLQRFIKEEGNLNSHNKLPKMCSTKIESKEEEKREFIM